MSKYDKTIAISHEEEGTYHRREYEQTPGKSKPITTYHTETIRLPDSKSNRGQVKKVPTTSGDDSDNDNFQEWTTSRRKVNHKTRQVETRVSRQILVEDGKVIADSGPQVITRIKEDNKVEECEKEKAPKNKGKFAALESAAEVGKGEATGRVLGEKKEIQRKSHEIREENMQYHDERFKELTGHDVHRRAIHSPHELITINDKQLSHESRPRGKMVHYSNKGKKYQDTDEISEVAKLAPDGSITKEVKRTKHHEEFSEDEEPDAKGEAEALKHEPIVTRSSRRHVDYVNDFDDTSTPSSSDNDDVEHENSSKLSKKKQHRHQHRHRTAAEDEAFPRYQIDPLLNSLRDEDFKPPMDSHRPASATTRHRVVERRPGDHGARHSSQSSDDDRRASRRRLVAGGVSRSPSPKHAQVEIPDEYRVASKQRQSSREPKSRSNSRQQREHSLSPQRAPSKLSHKSAKSHRSSHGTTGHREDAAVQARLTDEEVERKSIRSSSSSGLNTHEKTTKHLQRQSNANSSRTYYYGEPTKRSRHQKQSKRRDSISSSSSSSICDPKEQMRKQGTRSRDSGFKSPHFGRDSETTPQQTYSVSKSPKTQTKQRLDTISPTPSAGQRSVKTTTTTMSADLADRPLSRQSASNNKTNMTQPKRPTRVKSGAEKTHPVNIEVVAPPPSNPNEFDSNGRRQSFDTISLSSLGPNATTIKVPYQRVDENVDYLGPNLSKEERNDHEEKSTSEMSLQEDIRSLSKRLDDIKLCTGPTRSDDSEPKQFNYKTIIENISSTPSNVPKHQQNINAYNVQAIEQNSPFRQYDGRQIIINQFDDSCSVTSQLDRDTSQIIITDAASSLMTPTTTTNLANNNNEFDFNLREYAKYRAEPALVGSSTAGSTNMDYDRMSLGSCCSLQSSKTYNIRSVDQLKDIDYADTKQQMVQAFANAKSDSGINSGGSQQGCVTNEQQLDTSDAEKQLVFDENGDSKQPAAWFFDPRDGSSTVIAAPDKPKLERPQVDAKTEELVQARGGRSYYLELIELSKEKKQQEQQQQISIPSDSLYSRWTSQGALNTNQHANNNRYNPRIEIAPKNKPHVSETRVLAGQMAPEKIVNQPTVINSSKRPLITTKIETAKQQPIRRQLPFSGPPPSLAARSKSSSCLLSVTKPSKYSIYGGFRRPGDNNKPVPRLSYSRAIGPKSQRQIDNQPKTPSRYLKMR